MATCPDCGKPVALEGGFIISQEQSATCTCKVPAKVASAPISALQRKSIEKRKGLLARVAAFGTIKLEDGTLAIIFALAALPAIYALTFAENSWGRTPDLVFFLAFLVLTITVCLGLWTAVRGLFHKLLRERVLAAIGIVALAVALLYSGLGTLVLAARILWQCLGGGWTPFI